MKSVMTGGLVVFLIFFVVVSPGGAARITHAAWHGLVTTSHGVVTFIDKL